MSKPTILIVDDEQDILDLISYNLESEGFEVLKAENGQDGIKLVKQHKPNLVLLDIMMPKMDGLEVCEKLRKEQSVQNIPIIFLTARGDEQTEVDGLDRGADDFITKPISIKKLVSRIKAVLRRFDEAKTEVTSFEVHDIKIDRERYIVYRGDEKFRLPKKEFELLYYLISLKGIVLSREKLLNKIWGDDIHVVDRTVDVHIRKIREKLGDHYIETIKGVGYRFKSE
ncbi:MAG: response regulator [Balneolales bacterium]